MRALTITNSITRRDEKSLEKYLNDISKYDVLSPDEELNLFQRLRNGDEAALYLLVRHNLRFVVSVAKQYQHTGLWLGDLINEGNIGLMKAARRFDETKGFKFISYAVWWIRQSIMQAINDKGRKIRLPANHHAVTTKVKQAMIQFMQEEEREPNLAELSVITGIPPDNIQKSLEASKSCRSLDAPIEEGGETSLANLLEDYTIATPDHEVAIKDSQRKEVQGLLARLNNAEAKVLTLHYGIERKYPMTLSQISDHIGISKERARQIRDKGLKKLRKVCVDKGLQL